MLKLFFSLFLGTVVCTKSLAQTTSRRIKQIDVIVLQISMVQWNEELKLQNRLDSQEDFATFQGGQMKVGFNSSFPKWGWLGLLTYGQGRAIGGGANSFNYLEAVKWKSQGLEANVFWKWSNWIQTGLMIPVRQIQVTWPEASGTKVKDPRNFLIGYGLSLDFRLNPDWEIRQMVTTTGLGNETLWELGLGYRF